MELCIKYERPGTAGLCVIYEFPGMAGLSMKYEIPGTVGLYYRDQEFTPGRNRAIADKEND